MVVSAHGTSCPRNLLSVVAEYGRDELVRRLADPFWFQAFGCLLGFDWHSSGLTTTVCGALKEGLKPVSQELGLFVTGGKGKTFRQTPLAELLLNYSSTSC